MQRDRNCRARRDRRAIISLCVLRDSRGFLPFQGHCRAAAGVVAADRHGGGRARAEQLLVEQCGFCHGANARGGSGGPDLTRSVIVQEDEGGKQLGEFLRVGRPDRGMPTFDLRAAQVTDLATFLHAAIYLTQPPPLQDPRHPRRRSESGAGVLQRCRPLQQLPLAHRRSERDRRQVRTGALQGRLLMPRARPAPALPGRSIGPTAIKVTVDAAVGEPATGAWSGSPTST